MAAKELFYQSLVSMQILPVSKNAVAGIVRESREGGNNILPPAYRFTETASAGVPKAAATSSLTTASVTMSAQGKFFTAISFPSPALMMQS